MAHEIEIIKHNQIKKSTVSMSDMSMSQFLVGSVQNFELGILFLI